MLTTTMTPAMTMMTATATPAVPPAPSPPLVCALPSPSPSPATVPGVVRRSGVVITIVVGAGEMNYVVLIDVSCR